MSEGTSILPASSVDRRLLKAAAKRATPNEMSDAVMGALTPAQCIERVNQLLDSKDYLDEHRERRLMLYQVAEWTDWIQGQRDNEKAWPVISRSLKTLSDILERSLVNVDEVSTKLAAEHARYFIDGIVIGFDRALKELAERHEEIVLDDEEILEITQIGAGASQDYLDRVTMRESDDD